VVELVDTPASGAGDRKVVEVQVLSWAPSSISIQPLPSLFMTLRLVKSQGPLEIRQTASRARGYLFFYPC